MSVLRRTTRPSTLRRCHGQAVRHALSDASGHGRRGWRARRAHELRDGPLGLPSVECGEIDNEERGTAAALAMSG